MNQKPQYNSIYALLLKNHLVVAICLFIDAYLIRFAFLLSSDNFYGPEPMLNITTALHILTKPAFLQNIFYQQLPLFLYSLAGAVKLGSEQIVSARFFIAAASSLSLIPYYYLVKKIFNSKIALLSGVLLYSYYQHIIMSVVTMPEVIAIGFLFLCLWMVFEQKYLLGAVFCLIACGYSYLAWLTAPGIIIYILLKQEKSLKQKLLNSFLFLAISCIFPLFWNFLVDKQYGPGWLWYKNFHEADSLYTFLFLVGKTMRQILAGLFLKPESRIFFLGLIGIFSAVKKRKDLGYLLCVISIVFLLSLNVFRKEILILEQGSLFVAALLIPYLVRGLIAGLKALNLKRKIYALLATVIICLLSLQAGFFQRPEVPVLVKEASFWLQKNASADSLIYIQKQAAGFHSFIAMESGLPQLNFCYLPKEFADIEPKNKQQYLVLPLSSEMNIDFEKWDKIKTLKGYLIFQRIK
ncbi:MAG: glycosyltransferase family 39 protein [Candidatus Omnitrophota bacterium]